MSNSKKQRWAGLERRWSKMLNKFLVPSERITRAGNYSVSTYDVKINGAEFIKSDTKYRQAGILTNRLLDEVRSKYCKEDGDIPVLVCSGYKDRMKMTVDADFGALLLSYWLGFGTKEQLMKIYNKETDESLD